VERLRPSSKSTPRLNCRPRSRRLYWILWRRGPDQRPGPPTVHHGP
jgi:hypothetical protein